MCLDNPNCKIDCETCSYCTTEVPDSSLTDMPDGSRLCTDCVEDMEMSDADHADYVESIY